MVGKKNPVVIIGNCAASVYAIEAFREHDKSTPIVVVSKEPYLAYYRMKLSHLIGEDPDVNEILIHTPEWYEQNNVEILLGTQALAINPADNSVKLDSGQTLKYSSLLCAMGSHAFVPPVKGVDLKGVFSIRTLDDVKKLYLYSHDKEKGVIIGGGVLGLETAWSLAKKGKKITVVETSSFLLSNQLDAISSDILKSLGIKAGLNFILSAQLSEINGNDSVSSATLKDGSSIPAEFVIFSTGVRPNADILKDADIQTNRGVIVDSGMRTAVENIFAAGDVAEYNGKVYGIWPVAKEQGRIAGLNMAGAAASYSEIVPSNYIKVFDTDIFSAGDLCRQESDYAAITDTQPENKIYRKVFLKNNVPVGVILLGDTKPAMKISKAIKKRQVIPEEIIISNNFNKFIQEIDSN
ncbi:MAG: FAD-dependent oxidoreductase [Tepidanaerobacteraceae bacterium]|jgi:nitrite reductase (NADH) large subunit|nr:FAD-dependent oxidoreductase [Tepidanaerobacteraceae bacterium]